MEKLANELKLKETIAESLKIQGFFQDKYYVKVSHLSMAEEILREVRSLISSSALTQEEMDTVWLEWRATPSDIDSLEEKIAVAQLNKILKEIGE
jgi:hypothetical protein